jgi:hypothetical protein
LSSILSERTYRRSRLLLVVFGTSLLLVAATAVALVVVVNSNVETAAVQASVESDRSLVSGLIQFEAGDLSSSAGSGERFNTIQSQLATLLSNARGIVQVKIFAPSGTVLYSSDPHLVGENLGPDEKLAQAFATGKVAPTVEGADDGDAATTGLPPEAQVVEEYFPIADPAGGAGIPGVFEIYRRADLIVAAVATTTSQVIEVVLAAAAILGLLLFFIFQAAQRRLTRQTVALDQSSRRDALTGLLNHGTTVAAWPTCSRRPATRKAAPGSP